ncbi:GMC family oxidoreductase N-terminal domain-containing protein [Polaromonas sp. P1-6]|nr:GMC family oxidoreductase N-terminal domain-containing protein [Polaromonas sp. P1-6]
MQWAWSRVGGKEVIFRARGEIILSAGAIMSPKILQLSGIGPAALLQSLGMKVIADSPDVGAHARASEFCHSLPAQSRGWQ